MALGKDEGWGDPLLKAGRCTLYPVAMLEEWLRTRADRQQEGGERS